MKWKIAAILFPVLLAAVFIFQNHEPTKVQFLLWAFEASKALVLFLTLLIGVLIGGIITFPARKEEAKEAKE